LRTIRNTCGLSESGPVLAIEETRSGGVRLRTGRICASLTVSFGPGTALEHGHSGDCA